MTRHLPSIVFALMAWSSLTASAQTYTAKNIEFSNPGSFTQQQLESAAGMHAGSSFTAAKLAAAAQMLMDTGYFVEVSATAEGKLTAVTVKFIDRTVPLSQMLHVGFENFVWLSHTETEQAIQAKFPLFNGYLAENSPRQEDLKTALTAALAAKGVTAEVGYDEFEPTLLHPVREIAFSVITPSVRVANIKLGGVTPALSPLIQKSVNSTAHTAYLEGPADMTTADKILAPLLDVGYAQATLTNVTPTASSDVVLTATLNPGQIFHVSALTFKGTPVFPAADFQAAAKLHSGDVASRKQLVETLTPIDLAYRSKGYLDVVVDAHPRVDAAAGTVAYSVTVEPGEQYRVHEVTAQNLDAAAKTDFDRGFLLKAGDVYSPTYISGFLKNNTALRALEGYSAQYKAYADPATHLVDVVIGFVKTSR